MKIALLCSGLGRVYRGHEVFARGLFDLLCDDVNIVLFKGGGEEAPRERVIDHIPRGAPFLKTMHLPVAPKWKAEAEQVERMRIEGETFAYGALKPLLEGGFDVIHCLEQEVCEVIYANRHLFAQTPKLLWSNGGAIREMDQPRCDFVQEHSEFNLERSRRKRAFVIPHGIDIKRFYPGVESDFRTRYGIPENAFVVISVGAICFWHKRMDYVIREVAELNDAWLIIVGQETEDSAAIRSLGRERMGNRVVFASMPNDELPTAYAAADVFVLGSLFETFGIVYIEAMAMGLPVICSNHPNQRAIVKEGIFIDMKRKGALSEALRSIDSANLDLLRRRGPEIVANHYDLQLLKRKYIEQYQVIAATVVDLPRYSGKMKLMRNVRNGVRQLRSAVLDLVGK